MRYAFTKGIALLFIPILVLSQDSQKSKIDTTPARDKIYNLQDYLLSEDTKLVLDSDFGETISRVEINENRYMDINESEDFHYTQELEKRDDGIYLISADQHVDIFLFISKSMETSYPTPPLQLPARFKIGDEWTWNTYKVEDEDSILVTTSGRIEEKETLILPPGEFDAIRVVFNIETSEGEKSTVTQWLAPNLGRIKMNVVMEGGGFVGTILSLLGYDEIEFNLKKIQYEEVAKND